METHMDREKVEFKTGINPEFLAETLTTDIELVDALYDLIDNSIDAARNIIIRDQNYDKDEYGLPNNYSGYEVKLRLSENRIVVVDNCLGIDSQTVENKTFYTGDRSNHKFGIGHYGLGLKRALLKAGEQFFFMTDNGTNRYKSQFAYSQLSDHKQTIYGEKYKSLKKQKTIFVCSSLKQDAKDQLRSEEWLDEAYTELCLRYSEFIKKGLRIKLEYRSCRSCLSLLARPLLPCFRSSFPFSPKTYSLPIKASRGAVTANYSVGIYNDYRFPCEYENTGQKHNSDFTKWYGIYILCNDRVIVAHSFERKHGFNASFHSEYNGCICIVKINSEDPGLLPWNTAKTEIKVRNELFIEIKSEIEPLTSWYRSQAKIIINKWKSTKDVDDINERKRLVYQAMNWNDNSNTPCSDATDPSPNTPPAGEESEPNYEFHFVDDSEVEIDSEPKNTNTYNDVVDSEENHLDDDNALDTRIARSEKIEYKLNDLGAKKLCSLYDSMLRISLRQHPIVMYVSAWSFLESLSSLAGKEGNTDFKSFLGSKINNWYTDRNQKLAYKGVIDDIDSKGNSNKHHGLAYSTNAHQLANDFEVIEPLIIKIIEEAEKI